jgi:hypothetical protein
MHDERDSAERAMKRAGGAITSSDIVLDRLRDGEESSQPQSKKDTLQRDDADAESEDDVLLRKRAETTTDIDIPLPTRIARAASTLRLTEFNLNKDIVIGLCQERLSTTSSSVIIPWDQVASVEMITTSILSVTMQVHRYFGEDRGEKVFHPADVELFITHCNAPVLKSMIHERREFVRLRDELKAILSSGNIKCTVRTRARAGRNASRGSPQKRASAKKRKLQLNGQLPFEGDDEGVYDIDEESDDEVWSTYFVLIYSVSFTR